MNRIIECVPNFSEGNDEKIINEIVNAIKSVAGISVLNVDPGKATNRTVVTFIGSPEEVVDAAFLGIKKASELIDMRHHKGEHPRMGATDVCPFIPIEGISLEECVEYSELLAKRVGAELGIPVYLYESSAKTQDRKNLATIREGEYEGYSKKIQLPEWKPDYGPNSFNLKSGATVIGARDFLVAYNINLNTNSTRIANSIAFDVREQGRVKRIGHPLLGEIELDSNGEAVRILGSLKSVKAIGWYIEEYELAQISMNLTNINITPLHIAFDEVCQKAMERGVRVTGSEIVGMVPKKVLVDAGRHFLKKQGRSLAVPEKELIQLAVKTLGLNEFNQFIAEDRIIEYQLGDKKSKKLIDMKLNDFTSLTSSESPAPGGGSISAYVGSMGAALGAMVANLSVSKRGWEDKQDYFSGLGEKLILIMEKLNFYVDEDTKSFNKVMEAFALPKGNDFEKGERSLAIQKATLEATLVPLEVMKTAFQAFETIEILAKEGNQNSLSDVCVGALCINTCITGAYMNVQINLSSLKDEAISGKISKEAVEILKESKLFEAKILGNTSFFKN